MMASVTKIVGHTDMVAKHGALARWQARCFARPAHEAATAEQCADFAGHGPRDMGWPESLAKREDAA